MEYTPEQQQNRYDQDRLQQEWEELQEEAALSRAVDLINSRGLRVVPADFMKRVA